VSLKSFIERPKIRDKFKQEFSKPAFKAKLELMAPPLTNHYSLIGTTFDYLFRFHLLLINRGAETFEWAAEKSLHNLRSNTKWYVRAEKIITNAREQLELFLDSGDLTEQLLASTLRLAKLDSLYRSRFLDETMEEVDLEDIQDLKNLIKIVDFSKWKADNVCLLNPDFGWASTLVDGADVDIVIDDMIIDIKTVQQMKLTRDYFNQLIGYYTLHEIGGITGLPAEQPIKRLGIYFSRFGYLHTFAVDEVIDQETFPAFMEWFEENCL
jgi:hypothetical protein